LFSDARTYEQLADIVRMEPALEPARARCVLSRAGHMKDASPLLRFVSANQHSRPSCTGHADPLSSGDMSGGRAGLHNQRALSYTTCRMRAFPVFMTLHAGRWAGCAPCGSSSY
jgi:hypothetical protein